VHLFGASGSTQLIDLHYKDNKMTSWIEIPDAQLHTFWPVQNIGMVNRTGVTSLEQCKTICEGLSDCIFINWSDPYKICLTYQANEALQNTVQTFEFVNGVPVKWLTASYPDKLLSYEFRDPYLTIKFPSILTDSNFVGYPFHILPNFEQSRTLKTHMRGNPITQSSKYNYISVNYGLKRFYNMMGYGYYSYYWGTGIPNAENVTPGNFNLQSLINECDNDSLDAFSYCQVVDKFVNNNNQNGSGLTHRVNNLQRTIFTLSLDKNTSDTSLLGNSNIVPNSREVLIRGTLKDSKPEMSNQQKVIILTLVAVAVIAAMLYSLSSKILRY
jgi:hypothetical protein